MKTFACGIAVAGLILSAALPSTAIPLVGTQFTTVTLTGGPRESITFTFKFADKHNRKLSNPPPAVDMNEVLPGNQYNNFGVDPSYTLAKNRRSFTLPEKLWFLRAGTTYTFQLLSPDRDLVLKSISRKVHKSTA